MPSKISLGGNFTAAASWATVDATALLDSEAGNTALTTAYVESAVFQPGAITIDGIAVKLAARVASPTGTISVRLAQAAATVAGTEVTINVTDLPTCSTEAANNEGGWILFKFTAVTLAAATDYTVSAKCSVASEATLYRNGTAGNWARLLRTTTTGAPAAGDQLDIMGEHTGAATGNDFVITMDNTATTDFGSGTDASCCIAICKRATLNFAYAAATNYYLKCSGNVIVYNGGTLTIGTVANPIPRDGSAILEFDPVADGGMGLICRNGSTFTAQGLSRTLNKNVVSCKLNTDEAAAQTVLGVDTDTGWLVNDEIGIASTTRTYSQCEKRTLSAISATELTVSSGLTNAHSGTSPTQAEVILLTRNVKIRAAASTLMAYCNFKATATIDIDWVEFYWLGEETTGKRPVEIETTTSSCNIQYSSFHDSEDNGVYITGTATNNITFSNNVIYYFPNIGSVTNMGSIFIGVTSQTSITINSNIIIYSASSGSTSGAGIWMKDIGITVTNNTIAGARAYGIRFYEAAQTVLGTFSDNTIHSCGQQGLFFDDQYCVINSTLSNITIWRCSSYGIQFLTTAAVTTKVSRNITFSTLTLFGNTTSNIYFLNGIGKITFISLISNGDSSFATTNGISDAGNAVLASIELLNCDFSTVSGIKTAHTNDINVGANTYLTLVANNCKFGAATEVLNQTNLIIGGYIKSQKHDQTAGLHKSWFKYGIISIDTAIVDTGASQRLTPNNASNKLESSSKKVAVANTNTVTVSVKVRESVAGDGTDYNGNRIRLIVKKNIPMGITADTVLATATVASEGAFETINGTTVAVTDDGVLEFVCDCDGTGGGWINLDTWATS